MFEETELYRNTCFTNKKIKGALCSYYKNINANYCYDSKCDIFYFQEERLFEINAFDNNNIVLKFIKKLNKKEEYNYGVFDMHIEDRQNCVKVVWYEYTQKELVYVLVFRNNKNRYNVHQCIDRNSAINDLSKRKSKTMEKLIEENIELVNQISEKDLIAYYITHKKLIHNCAIFKSSSENTNDIKLELICLKSTSNDKYHKLLDCIKKINEETHYKYGQFNFNASDNPKDMLSAYFNNKKTVTETKEQIKVLWYEYGKMNKYILVFNTDEELNKVHDYVNRRLLNTMSEKDHSKKLSHFLGNLLEKELFMYYCNGEDNELHKSKCAFFRLNESLNLVCVENQVTEYSTLLTSIRKLLRDKDTEYESGQFDLHITQRRKKMKVLWYRCDGYLDYIFVFRINKNRDNACKFLTK